MTSQDPKGAGPNPQDKRDDEVPTTSLADLVRAAEKRLAPEPDRLTPAATRTMAAIVRDLKGLPELSVSRESQFKIRLARRGKIGALTVEFKAPIRAMELDYVGWPGADPMSIKMRRYVLDFEAENPTVWNRLEGGGDLIDDIRQAMLQLYPELADV